MNKKPSFFSRVFGKEETVTRPSRLPVGKSLCISCGLYMNEDAMICDNCGKVYLHPDFSDSSDSPEDEERALAEWYGVSVTGRKLINGVYWSIIRRENSLDYIKYIHQHEKMQVRFLNEYSLVEVEPRFIFETMSAVQDESIDDLWDSIEKTLTLKQAEFEKFLVVKGMLEEGYCGKIAILHTRGGNVIYKDIQIPAFNLSLESVMTLMSLYGYVFKVGDEYISPTEASEDEETMRRLWNSLIVISVRAAVLVEIKATLSSEEYRCIKNELKMNVAGIDE